MRNLAEFINELNKGKAATYPDMSLSEAELSVSLAIHATNFLTPYGGISGYKHLIGTLYQNISNDHGKVVADKLFSTAKGAE